MSSFSQLSISARFLRLGNIPLYFSGIVALVALNVIFTAVYNVYFHPLRKCKLPSILKKTATAYKTLHRSRTNAR